MSGLASGCERGSESPAGQRSQRGDTRPPISARAEELAGSGRAKHGVTASTHGAASQLVMTGAGSAYRVPPPPHRTVTTPDENCVPVQSRRGRREHLAVPAAPGLAARRVGDAHVRVSYRFRRVPRSCTAVRLKLSVDVSNDTLAGSATYIHVNRTLGAATILIPDDLRDADVLRATAYSRNLLQSRSTAVLIR